MKPKGKLPPWMSGNDHMDQVRKGIHPGAPEHTDKPWPPKACKKCKDKGCDGKC